MTTDSTCAQLCSFVDSVNRLEWFYGDVSGCGGYMRRRLAARTGPPIRVRVVEIEYGRNGSGNLVVVERADANEYTFSAPMRVPG
jgi:hypothetical protein